MNDQLVTGLHELTAPAPAMAVNAAIVASGVADGYLTRPSTVGDVYVAFSKRGVSAVDLADSPIDFEDRFAHTHGRTALAVKRLPARIERHLDTALEAGKPGRLALDFSGLTDFQKLVLHKTAEIPAGQVRPYSWVAREIGRPRAGRAVGSALARNPIPIVVPCHRVVRSDGRLGNYSLGDPSNKRVLLESEGLDLDQYQSLSQRGIRLTGSVTTNIFCNPTCHHARRASIKHTVEFRSETEARRAGFRPCKVCRPGEAA